MKYLLLAILITYTSQFAIAQENESDKSSYDSFTNNEVQTKPEFPGGVKAFYQYVIDNFKPDSKVKGSHKLHVFFVVEKDGNISNVKVTKGLDEMNDQKLIEVIKQSPKWSPDIMNGKPVRASYGLPLTINFK